MRLKEIQETSDFRVYHFIRLRSDGAELDSLLIKVDTKSVIQQIEILDNIEGSCALTAGGRLLHCTAWESEAEAQDSSHWSKHYTQRVGKRTGDFTDAVRIFQSLERCIHDTYLKHILRIFPRRANLMEFDTDLYSLYEPPPQPAVPDPVHEPTAAITNPREPFSRRLAKSVSRSRIILIALVVTIASTGVISMYLYNRPPELPPKTAEMLSMAGADLLPMLEITRAGLENALAAYANQVESGDRPFIRAGAAVEFRNEQDFVDRLYALDEEMQLSTFHDKILQNGTLGGLLKARILHRLYYENLVRVIDTGPDRVITAFNYLRRQLPKAVIIRYMFYLLLFHGGSAVATEAHFILQSLAEIQYRLTELIFYQREIREMCMAGKLEWLKYPNEAMIICDTRSKYSDRVPADAEKAASRFNDFQISAMDRAMNSARTNYRSADVQFMKALKSIQAAQDPQRMEQGIVALLRIPNPAADNGDIFQSAFFEMRRLVASRHEELTDLRSQAVLQARMDNLARESDSIRSRLNRSVRAMTSFKSLESAALHKHLSAELKKLAERQQKFAKPR